MCTIGGASTNQESTVIAETLAVLISKGAFSRLPCTHRHLATTVQVPMLLKQTCVAVSFPVYPTPCCPKGCDVTFTSVSGRDHCPALLVAGLEHAHSRTGLGMPEVLAEPPKLENTSAEEFWKDNEILFPNTTKLLIKL